MAKRAKFQDGTFGQGVEWLHDFFYDRVTLANNLVQTSLFRNKANDQRNGVTLTELDTNGKSDRVPTNQKWQLWKLYVIYQAIAARDDAGIQLILNQYRTVLLTYRIENLDVIWQVPMSYFLSGMQLISAPAVTVNSKYPSNLVMACWELKVPIVLEENTIGFLNYTPTVASGAALVGDFVLFVWEREMFRAAG
jgi:hypothetical protein